MRTYDGLTNQAGRTPHPSGHPFSEIILYLPLYIHLSIHLRSQSPVLSLLYSATLCTFARATIWPPTCSFVSNASNIYLPSSNVLPMQLSFHFISQSNTLNVHKSFRSSTISLALSLSLSLFLSSSLLVRLLLLFLHPLHPPPLSSTMLQMGDVLPCFSAVFLLLLLGTRSATGASLLTVFLYVFLMMFRFPPVPTYQAGRVLRPRAPSGGVSVVASRGGTHDAPENTVAAIREASRNGATGVQLDLSFTADGVPVLMHDETVDRTTNGSGPVNKLQIVQLRRLDAAAHHRLKDKFSAEKVPTLQEAVEECIKHQLTIFFDVKGEPDKSASVLHQMYKKFPALYNSSVVSSFEPKVIYKMRQTDPNVVTALIHRPWRLSHFADATPRSLSVWGQIWLEFLDVLLDWAHHHILWKLCGVSAVLIQKDFISVDYVQYWAERGVEVVGWTVNTAVEKDFYQNLLKIGYITDSLLEDCDPQY